MTDRKIIYQTTREYGSEVVVRQREKWESISVRVRNRACGWVEEARLTPEEARELGEALLREVPEKPGLLEGGNDGDR